MYLHLCSPFKFFDKECVQVPNISDLEFAVQDHLGKDYNKKYKKK